MASPKNQWRNGKVSVSEWENEKGNNYSVQKSYKDKDTDKWINKAVTFFPEELYQLRELLAGLELPKPKPKE